VDEDPGWFDAVADDSEATDFTPVVGSVTTDEPPPPCPNRNPSQSPSRNPPHPPAGARPAC